MAGPNGVASGVCMSASRGWNAGPLSAATNALNAARILPYSARAAAVAACKSSASVDSMRCEDVVGLAGLYEDGIWTFDLGGGAIPKNAGGA
jgi:hypothetical protein